MAFITLEDLVGTVEIIIFPKDYERYAKYLENDGTILFILAALLAVGGIGYVFQENQNFLKHQDRF